MRRLWTFIRLPIVDKLLLIEAFSSLLWSLLLVFLIPSKRWLPRLGKQATETPTESDEKSIEKAKQIGWAINAISRTFPWKLTCLTEATAAKFMLNRRNIDSTLYLGVKMNREDVTSKPKIEAHAWLRSGKQILTGKDVYRQFKPISSFGEHKR